MFRRIGIPVWLTSSVLCVAAVSANAQTTIATSLFEGAAPDDAYVSNVQPTFTWLNWDGNTRPGIGQTFTPTQDFTATTVNVMIGATDETTAEGAAFTLQLFEYDKGDYATPLGPALVSGTGTLPSAGLEKRKYLTFTLPPVPLQRGHAYGFVLTFSDPKKAGKVVLANTQDSTYFKGRVLMSTNGQDFTSGGSNDLNFFVNGEH